MKHSDLSDFEINKLVAKVLLDDKTHWSTWVTNDGCSKVWFVDETKNNERVLFNPCNNPSDAWSIIVGNGICINAMPGGDFTLWYAHDKFHTDIDKAVYDENPLRAAMIVFLMMNEGETK